MGERTVGAQPIRLAVVDDHPAIAAAIRAAIRADVEPSPTASCAIELVATARTAAEGLGLFGPDVGAPDVVLCDLQLGERADGLDVLDAAVKAGSRVIVLTAFDRSAFARAAFDRRASGFLSKGLEVEAILDAVRSVAAGGTAFSSASLDELRSPRRLPSPREVAILSGISRGLTSQEIALSLRISVRTVESHLRRLFDRYGVVSRTELAVLAEREGWLAVAGE